MPLNPPSYNGIDVYYSTNVFVNKVPVALWRPPAGAFNDGSPGTASTPGGIPMYSGNADGAIKLYKNIISQQGAGTDGLGNDDDSSPAAPSSPVGPIPPNGAIGTPGATGYNATGASGPTGPDPNPSAPAPDGSYELSVNDLPSNFPVSPRSAIYDKRISKYFKFGEINIPPSDWPAPVNLSARQIAANWINLALNVLDPVYAQFHFIKPMSSVFRPWPYPGRPGDHMRGMAADISLGNHAFDGNRAMFKWLLNSGIKFKQLIYEEGPTSIDPRVSWVHVSYDQGRYHPNPDFRVMSTTNGGQSYLHHGTTGNNGSSPLPSYLR